MSGSTEMQRNVECYCNESLGRSLLRWTEQSEESGAHLSSKILQQMMEVKAVHSNCNDLQHETMTQKLCTLLTKDFMTSILDYTLDPRDVEPMVKFVVEGNGHQILKCLLKFGTKTIGCKVDLFKLLWYLINLKRSAVDIRIFDMSRYNDVCSVCVQLIADLCVTESLSLTVKLAQDALPEFMACITNLLLENAGTSSESSSPTSSQVSSDRTRADYIYSIDSLMLSAIRSYCTTASLICNSKQIADASVLVIVGEVASSYSAIACSTLQNKHVAEVLSACVVGLFQVLESLLCKLHSLAHTMTLSVETLQLLSSILPPHTEQLIALEENELIRRTVSAMIAVIRQMKESKVKHVHNLKCHRKKHRHCDMSTNFHHHNEVLSITVASEQHCGTAYVTRLLLNLYQRLPLSCPIKMEMLEWIQDTSGCCCMTQADYITPLLADDLSDYSETKLHTLMSTVVSVMFHQLAARVTNDNSACELCSQGSSKLAEDTAGIGTLKSVVLSDKISETDRRIVLQHLCTAIAQCNPQLVFLLYRHVFKPLLDLFYSNKSAVGMESIRLSLTALTHALTEDGCIDHFMSSAYSMKILELCVAEYNSLLPLVLQVFSLLIRLRSEEQVLTPLLTILLGEPEVQTSSSDFVVIELIYETPDFNAPLSERHMMLTSEKWSCCHRLLQQSALFRTGFQSQSGVQLLLGVAKSIISTMVSNASLSSTQQHFLTQLLPTVIGCLQLSVYHQLTLLDDVFTVKILCIELYSEFIQCDFDSNRDLSVERSYQILRLLLDCSSHKLPARCSHRRKSQGATEDQSKKEHNDVVRCSSGTGDQASNSDNSASSSEGNEADDESYHESSVSHHSSYDNYDLVQPELWILTFDLMKCDQMSLNRTQIYTLVSDMDRLLHNVDSWQFLQHKVELALNLLRWYGDGVIDGECDPLARLVLSIVEYVSYLDMNSDVLLELFTLLKLSNFKSHLLASVHTVITQSRRMPGYSISFPLDRNDKESDIGVIVSRIDKFGTQSLSVILWVYLDGSISTGYNSKHKSKQPVQLLNIMRSQLTITLQSEVTNGNVCLVIANGMGDLIGRVPVPSVLTTNKWQMISFTADIKIKENLQIYVQFSLGVDGREIKAGSETFTAPNRVTFDDQSNLELHVGQRSNLYVKKHSIHLAHALIFTGCLSNVQCAEMYSLGPGFHTFSRCIADIDVLPPDRRSVICRQLPSAALEHLMRTLSTSELKQTLQRLVTVVGPKYKPWCLVYNRYPLTNADKFLSVPQMRNRLLSYLSMVEEQPAAYYGELSVVKHVSLEGALANLGGNNLLLYMYAQCVELRLSESSQQLALECLLYSCAQSADVPLATQQPLDYKMLSKVLQTEQCLLTPAITKVLLDFGLRQIEGDILLVDMKFIEQVLLDWAIWQCRPQSWKPIWTSLCQSVSAGNKFRLSNSTALLECEILQTAIRIPLVQYQKDSMYPLTPWFTSQLSLMVYRSLDFTHDKRLIWDVCMHLLLLHPAAATFIQYDKGKLYPTTHWDRRRSSPRSSSSSSMQPLYRQSSDQSDLDSTFGLEDSTAFFSEKYDIETDDSKEGYTSEEGMSDQSPGSPAISADLDAPSTSPSSPNCDLASVLRKHYSLRSDSDITVIPESDEQVPANTPVGPACASTDSSSQYRDCSSGPSSSVTDVTFNITFDTTCSLAEESFSPDFTKTLTRPMNDPSSPTFELSDKILPDRPDIIASHDDFERPDETTTEHALAHISANLLHMLLLITNDLTDTDKQIFCTDLMTLDTLTVFLNHDDVDVVYAAFKLLSRVIEMSSTEDLEQFIKKRGFHLVASQLNQVMASDKLVNVCARLVNGQSCSAMSKDELSNPFILPLIGILEKCCHDLTLCSKAFSFLFQIFEERVSSLGYAVRNGLIQVLCNCMMSLNDRHPYVNNDDMDNLLAYMHTFLQKIANHVISYGKNEARIENIKTLLCLFMLMERKERRDQPGNCAVVRVETAVRLIFQELYTSIKQGAMAKPMAFFERMLSRGSEMNKGLEDGSRFAIKRVSLGGGSQSLTASMTSLHSTGTESVDSKNSKTSLTELLLCVLQEFVYYSMYRVGNCKNDYETVSSVTELLVDTLIIQEDQAMKRSLWTAIVESDKVRASVWKMLSDILTFMVSPSCDKTSAECVIAVFTQLPDASQKRIVDNLTGNEFLVPHLGRFLQKTTLKASTESFLKRVLNKRFTLLRSTSAPSITTGDKTETNTHSLWMTSHSRARCSWKKQLAERKHRAGRTLDRLVKDLRNAAMEVNKDVVHRQNLERKKFVELMKINMAAEVSVRKEWQRIITQFTHERAVWTDPSRFPQSWEIDPTEGPGRVRKRLQRCHLLNIAPKFLLEEQRYKLELSDSGPPLPFLFEEHRQMESASAALIYRLHTNETISFTCKCSNVTPSTETHGEILISDDCIHFVGDDAISDYNTAVLSGSQELLSIRWPHNEIKCFYKRRYQLQDNALEIFLTSGRASLLAVDNTKERDILWEKLNKLNLPNLTSSADLESIQKQWLNGNMTNFDYLTHLNTLAGRSYNDLMQYPVFPFVLNNYDGDFLELDDTSCYRKLHKPIASQIPSNETKFKQHYEAIEADIELSKHCPDSTHISMGPYHYASHYSNSGVVLHYLIRLLPYSHMFLKYQDGQFDIPDRTFHSMQTSWLLSSERSSTDVKELIPEFYYLPEFLVNYEGFDFGKRQNKAQVDSLNLPDWCKQDNRLFVMILRQSLENSIVTSHLQNWINLTFGYQQQGEAAKAAVNKFHPATYYGLEVNSIEDELQQNAIKVMIRTYGQMPKQLFTTKHPEQTQASSTEQRAICEMPVLETVSGLCWGDYLGSPADTTKPKVALNEMIGAQRVAAVTSEEIFGLNSSSNVITHATKSGDELSSKTDRLWAARLTWNHPDNVLKLQTQKNKQSINFLSLPYKVTACTSVTDCGLLLIASESGIIQVHRIQYSKQKLCELSWIGLEVTLIGHHSPITSLVVSKEFSVIVSTDESGLCIIWDLNKRSYVRCIQNETKSKIDCVTVSPTMGDIAFCSQQGKGSVVEVLTINAKPISKLTLSDKVSWLCYSAAPEGLSVNALVGALSNATIQFWSSWDLKPIRTLSVSGMTEPFICCTFTPDNQRLAANTSSGRVIVWDRPRVGSQGVVRCLPAD